MPFLTQGKTNWKYIIIVVILAVIVGGGILSYCQWNKIPKTKPLPINEQKLAEDMITDFMNARMGDFGEGSLNQAKNYLTENAKQKYSQIQYIDFALFGISNPHYSRYEILNREKLDSTKFKFIVRIYEYLVEIREKGDFQYFDEELTVVKKGNNYLVDSVERGETVIIQDGTVDWKTYRNEEYGFEIKYPQDWYEKYYDPEYYIVEFQNRDCNFCLAPGGPCGDCPPGGIIIGVSLKNNPEKIPLGDFIGVEDYYGDECYSIESVSISGIESIKISFLCDLDAAINAKIVYIPQDDKIFAIHYGSDICGEDFGQCYTIFSQMLSTFRFLE